MRKAKLIIVWTLVAVLLLTVLLPASLYIPKVQDWVSQGVVAWLNRTSEDLQYEVGSVRLAFPLQLQVRDLTVRHRLQNRPMLQVGRLQTGLDAIPWDSTNYVVNNLRIEDVEVMMDTLTESIGLTGRLGLLQAKRIVLDRSLSDYKVGELLLESPDVHLMLGPSQPDTTETQQLIRLEIGRIVVRDGIFRLDRSDMRLPLSGDSIVQSPYLDYNHLRLDAIDLVTGRIAYQSDPQEVQGEIKTLKVAEVNSGLVVQGLEGRLDMAGDRICLDDLDLQLAPRDYVRGSVLMDLSVLDSIPHGMADVALELAVDSANLLRVAAPYVPQLEGNWVNEQCLVAVDARLVEDSLDVSRLTLTVPRHMDLSATSRVAHLMDNVQRQGNVRLKAAMPNADPLLTAWIDDPDKRGYALPDSLILDLAAIQQRSSVKANVNMKQLARELLVADASYDTGTEAYQLKAVTSDLDVSHFVPAVAARHVSARVYADGRHLDLTRGFTRLDASLQVDSLYYTNPAGRKDSLNGLNATASLIDGNYLAEVRSEHPTLQLESILEGCYRRDSVSVSGFVDVRSAILDRLPFVEPSLQYGHLLLTSHIDAGYDWHNDAKLRVRIDTLDYQENDLHHAWAGLLATLDAHDEGLHATLVGSNANLWINTTSNIAQLTTVADSAMAVVNDQMKRIRPDIEAIRQRLPQIQMDVEVKKRNPVTYALEYYTGMTLDRAWIHVENDSQLHVTGKLYNLVDANGDNDYDTLTLAMHPGTLPRSYDYQLHAVHRDIKPSHTHNVYAQGRLMPDSLTLGFTYRDGRELMLYDVMASLALADDTMTLHLEQEPTLMEQQFSVNKDNYVRLMQYLDLDLRKPTTQARLMMDGPRDVKINLYTRPLPNAEVGNQLLFMVRNLDLEYASSLMEWDMNATGRFNLTASANIFPDSLSARLRSGISRLTLQGYKADTLALDARYAMAHNRKDASGSLRLDSVERVSFEARLADSINVQAGIDELPLTLVGAFLPKNMRLSGSASGSFDIRGRDMDDAQINGGLAMNNAGMVYTDLNAKLKFPNDTIRFGRNRLLIRDYKILAANNNPINIRGIVDMSKEMANPTINLTVKGENVWLLNSKKLSLHDQYVYGRLPVSPDIKIKGTPSNLDVTGRLNLLSGTDLNYFMQDDPLESSSRVEQLVEFIRFDEVDRMIQTGKFRRQNQTPDDQRLNMDLRIDIANDAKVAAHLAGAGKNRVDIVGGAGLNLQCGEDGKLVMTGSYNIVSGLVDYKLPILPMVKTFGISPSSMLDWQGCDPGNPTIDIMATEEVKTTVNDDAGSRVVRFIVSIHIAGTLEALNLTFDCSAPDDGTISSDLATLDADERSKAALMLLIAQTYIGPGNSSSMGLGTANAALNSMINRQMNSMLSGMKGTNIDLGIDTYNTDAGNTRTNYSVKVSQQLFNDRFRATIGGQVSSGGDAGQSAGARLGDLSLEWMIRKDGSHYLKLFRSTNYESVLEGELIETGISYVQERSGYRWRQLFIPTSKKRQQQTQTIIREMQQKEEQAEREARRRRVQSTDSLNTQIHTESH